MSLSHVLLALIVDRPASGYALKKRIDGELSPLWSAELSQIYPALARLKVAGFLAGRVVGPAAGPASCRYRATASGRRELARWLAGPPHPGPVRDETLVRVVVGRALGGAPPGMSAAYDRTLREEAAALRQRPDTGPLDRLVREAALARLDALRRWARSGTPPRSAGPRRTGRARMKPVRKSK